MTKIIKRYLAQSLLNFLLEFFLIMRHHKMSEGGGYNYRTVNRGISFQSRFTGELAG